MSRPASQRMSFGYPGLCGASEKGQKTHNSKGAKRCAFAKGGKLLNNGRSWQLVEQYQHRSSTFLREAEPESTKEPGVHPLAALGLIGRGRAGQPVRGASRTTGEGPEDIATPRAPCVYTSDGRLRQPRPTTPATMSVNVGISAPGLRSSPSRFSSPS